MSEGILDVGQAYKLDNPGRIEELKPYRLLKDLVGVRPGLTCVDFGSGTGTFALPMSELVGDQGKIYAVDNSSEMLEHIRSKNPPPNMTLIHGDVEHVALNDRTADICFLAFILHEVKQSANLIEEACRLLKPEGILAVVEWRADVDSFGPPRKKRISREQLEQLFGQVGLTVQSYILWTDNHYVAIGIK